MGTSKNRPYSSNATKLPANDSASFPFRFINVRSEAVSDRQREQFFEVPSSDYPTWITKEAYGQLAPWAKTGGSPQQEMWKLFKWTAMNDIEVYGSSWTWSFK